MSKNRAKYEIILLFSITYGVYYLCRYNYNIALPFIQEEFSLSTAQVGLVATCLTAGYAIGQLINGVLVDRKGAKIIMTIGGIGSMVANIFTGLSPVFNLLIAGWMINGYFQAMGYPSTLKLVANWFKQNEQGKALGINEFTQSIASILVLPLSGFLAVQFSWRFVFIVPGIMLGLVTIWYYMRIQDRPSGEYNSTNYNPKLIPDMKKRYRAIFGNWRVLCACFSYGSCQFVRYAIMTWIPFYFFLETGMDIFKAALASSVFQIGGAAGSIFIGWLSDLKIFRYRRWLLIAIGMGMSGILSAFIGFIPLGRTWMILVVLATCGVMIESLEVAYFLIPVDKLGPEMAGTGVGCMNATGKAIASLQGVVLGSIIDHFGFRVAFGLAGFFGLLAMVLILPAGRLVQHNSLILGTKTTD
jgi:MFS transporter, OPA family, glycerol-3-phosphate transporter